MSNGLARILHQTETFMAKALRGEAVVHLPRASNNTGHERLCLARRVKWFHRFSSCWAQPRVPWLTKPYPHLTMELSFWPIVENISCNVRANMLRAPLDMISMSDFSPTYMSGLRPHTFPSRTTRHATQCHGFACVTIWRSNMQKELEWNLLVMCMSRKALSHNLVNRRHCHVAKALGVCCAQPQNALEGGRR